MLYLDLRLGQSLSETRREKADKHRLQKTAAETGSRRLTQQLGRKRTALGDNTKEQRDRAA